MKKIFAFLSFIIAFTTIVNAQQCVNFSNKKPITPEINLLTSNIQTVSFEVVIPCIFLLDTLVGGTAFKRLILPFGTAINSVGAPEIPILNYRFAIPNCSGIAISYNIVSQQNLDSCRIYPVPQILFEQNPEGYNVPVEYFHFDTIAYAQPRSGNEPIALVSSSGTLRSQQYVEVMICPVIYCPVSQELSVIDKIAVTLTFNNPQGALRQNVGIFNKMATNAFINYEDDGMSAIINDKAYTKDNFKPGTVKWITLTDTAQACQIVADYLIITDAMFFKPNDTNSQLKRLANHRSFYNGLQTLCNTFDNSHINDILVNYKSSIRQYQGSVQQPAGNLFTGIPILNIDNSATQCDLTYYYAIQSNEYPNSVSYVNLIAADSVNQCPERNGANDAIIIGGDTAIIIFEHIKRALSQYDEWNEQYEYWLAKLLELSDERYEVSGNDDDGHILQMVSYYSALKDNHFNSIIVAVMDDEIIEGEKENGEGRMEAEEISPSNFEGVDGVAGRGSLYENLYETLRFLFSYRNHYTDNLSIIETYLAESNYSTAYAVLSNIFEQFELTDEQVDELTSLQVYIDWMKQLEENDGSIYQLPESELEYLVNYVENNTGRGTVFANNILCVLYGICLEDEMMRKLDDKMIEGEKEKGEGKKEKGEKSPSNFEGVDGVAGRGSLYNITLVPNPTTGELRIENGELRITGIEVFDVYGRKLSHIPYLTSQISNLINISHLQAGIYIIAIHTNQGTIHKKIVKK